MAAPFSDFSLALLVVRARAVGAVVRAVPFAVPLVLEAFLFRGGSRGKWAQNQAKAFQFDTQSNSQKIPVMVKPQSTILPRTNQ